MHLLQLVAAGVQLVDPELDVLDLAQLGAAARDDFELLGLLVLGHEGLDRLLLARRAGGVSHRVGKLGVVDSRALASSGLRLIARCVRMLA